MNDTEQKTVFSANLNRYLSASGLTQKEVADKIGVSPQTFNTWCKGIAIPRMGKIQKIADYFGIHKSDLIDDASSSDKYESDSIHTLPVLTDLERKLLDNYRSLNPEGQGKASDYLEDLVASGRYTVADNLSVLGDGPISIAAHERTDIEVTDEMREHDMKIMLDDDF